MVREDDGSIGWRKSEWHYFVNREPPPLPPFGPHEIDDLEPPEVDDAKAD